MKKGLMFIVVGYGAWIILNLVITVFKIGDAGVNAHLALIFTGLPASLLSLLAPHGTLVAVLIAGVLGLVQWVLVAKLWKTS
ncbi:MAG: hypothetical protein KBT63_09210 [Porticoccaceae bacterium]|nr:hypothetical protein [Porticoccaceae bacterium]